MGFVFPFPGSDLALQELKYDPCYAKIAPQDYEGIVETAWERGTTAAKNVFKKFDGSYNFYEIMKKSGLACEEKDIDYVFGKQRYFSDYLSGKNTINLYLKSVQLWANENSFDMGTAKNLILSHEYFHFLECNSIGLTSKLYLVPMLKIGPLALGKTGIRAMSEIGAHAFARTYYDLVAESKGV